VREVLRDPRHRLALFASGVLIAVNWGIFIWAVSVGRLVEASFGYYLNPLVNVGLGVLLLGERLRRPQQVAIGIAAFGVIVLGLGSGAAPWLPLSLAASFGLYGLLRKLTPVSSLSGLTVETALLAPLALGYLLLLVYTGEGHLGGAALGTNALLVFSGVVTALPLIFFASAAKRLVSRRSGSSSTSRPRSRSCWPSRSTTSRSRPSARSRSAASGRRSPCTPRTRCAPRPGRSRTRGRESPLVSGAMRGVTRRGFWLRLVVGLGCVCVSVSALAEPLTRRDVPEPLAPWVDWVLRGSEDALCALVQDRADMRLCAFPARVELDHGDLSGRFRAEIRLARAEYAPLPGDAALWPQDVEVDGKPAVVIGRDGVPSVWLPAGRHVITGGFAWSALPEGMAVPLETALLTVRVNGAPLERPRRDGDGRVWLRRRREADTAESRLDVAVNRRVDDAIPLELRPGSSCASRGRAAHARSDAARRLVALSLERAPRAARERWPPARVRPGDWLVTLRARACGRSPRSRRPGPRARGPTRRSGRSRRSRACASSRSKAYPRSIRSRRRCRRSGATCPPTWSRRGPRWRWSRSAAATRTRRPTSCRCSAPCGSTSPAPATPSTTRSPADSREAGGSRCRRRASSAASRSTASTS
jgi:RarD protein